MATAPQAISKALNCRHDDQSLFGQLVSFTTDHIEHGTHCRVFMAWLSLPLERKIFQLRQFLASQKEPSALLERWVSEKWYERLIPTDAAYAERQLFLNDFQIIAAIVYSDLQPETGNPDLCFPPSS